MLRNHQMQHQTLTSPHSWRSCRTLPSRGWVWQVVRVSHTLATSYHNWELPLGFHTCRRRREGREGGEGGREGREERKREEKVISLSCSFLGSWDYLPSDEDEEDLALSAHVLHSRRPCSNLPPKDVGEDLGHILLGLRWRCEGVRKGVKACTQGTIIVSSFKGCRTWTSTDIFVTSTSLHPLLYLECW